MLGALTGFVSLMGIFFGAEPLYRLPGAPVIGVALPTSISVLLISAGLLFERTERGLMGAATAPTPGGTVIRRLMPAAILGPAFLGLMVSSIFAAVGIQDLPLDLAQAQRLRVRERGVARTRGAQLLEHLPVLRQRAFQLPLRAGGLLRRGRSRHQARPSVVTGLCTATMLGSPSGG